MVRQLTSCSPGISRIGDNRSQVMGRYPREHTNIRITPVAPSLRLPSRITVSLLDCKVNQEIFVLHTEQVRTKPLLTRE